MLAMAVLGVQMLLLGYFCFFGFYNYLYSIASLFAVRHATVAPSGARVAVVIVSFNEKEVLADTVRACEKLSYAHKTIIVGDDSNDGGTYELLKGLALERGCTRSTDERFVAHDKTEVWESEDFVVFHRLRNDGFKAGNLKELEKYLKAKGFSYMYLLDADWHPQTDTLERCLSVIEADDSLAYVQTKRLGYHGPLDHLQRCLAINEEGCYYVDLPGRHRVGDPVLFTGCCALFRLSALYQVEGFLPGHLTEDIDLTNRFFLAGWKGAYLEDVENEGEVPPDYPSVRRQQERWTMGSARTFKHYFWPIVKSRKMGVREKLGLLRQNAYFTTSIAIELSIVTGLVSMLWLIADTENLQAVLYQYYLQQVGWPFTVLLGLALISNFVPLLVTVWKKRRFENLVFIPYATWLSWSLLHTYFVANVKGFLDIKADWFKTPKNNRAGSRRYLRGSYLMKAVNTATLALLLTVYGIEWYAFGMADLYAFFWIPALVVGMVFS